MTDVSVIGLGAMGSALARVLLQSGRSLTVWNRSAAKAVPLVEAGATLAGTVAAAVGASPVTVICVDNYTVAQTLLAETGEAAAGRLLVQLSTGGPQEARDAQAWAHAHGAQYVDGAILAFPPQMGSPEATIIASGASAAFHAAEGVLRTLAPNLNYLGEAVGAAAAQDCAVAAYFAGGLIGALHGARICEAEGLRVDEYCALMAEISPVLGGDVDLLGRKIAADEFANPGASIKTWSAAITRLVRHAKDVGINDEFPSFAAGLFQRGLAAGYGGEEVAALIKVLRAG